MIAVSVICHRVEKDLSRFRGRVQSGSLLPLMTAFWKSLKDDHHFRERATSSSRWKEFSFRISPQMKKGFRTEFASITSDTPPSLLPHSLYILIIYGRLQNLNQNRKPQLHSVAALKHHHRPSPLNLQQSSLNLHLPPPGPRPAGSCAKPPDTVAINIPGTRFRFWRAAHKENGGGNLARAPVPMRTCANTAWN
ncbi:hypothetical protein CDAR_417051 [Caerostris darwini]|uniref:Uncharacterized protein n=1 Tax=Caerostris darwini TaxID=1538125 RepID=A0AAV4X6Q9_9ARAC|nr:hypothetical protein CDAR_417051 [Caerostris darwini]